MKLDVKLIEELKVSPGHAANLVERSTSKTSVDWLGATGSARKEIASEDLQGFTDELKASQELLWATGSNGLLVVLQAMDAAGKDGTIKHVMSGVNPQGCQVVGFKQPSAQELEHDFLWRYHNAAPARGSIGIFNRSYYEEVLVVKVHPELAQKEQGTIGKLVDDHFWKGRYEDINGFEQHLHRSGTRIVKIFLHLSKEQQRKRFLERLEDPSKYWKFSTADLAERAHWDEYQLAFEESISATSTSSAPWFVVPADHKYLARALVGGILVHTIDQLGLKPPHVDPSSLDAIAKAKSQLQSEKPVGKEPQPAKPTTQPAKPTN